MLKNNLHAFVFVFGSGMVMAAAAYVVFPIPETDTLLPISSSTWQLPQYKQSAAARPFNALTKGSVRWAAEDNGKKDVVIEDEAEAEAKARNWILMGFLQVDGMQHILVKLNPKKDKKEASQAEKGKSSQLKRYQVNDMLPDDSKIIEINLDHVVLQKMDETDIVYLYPQK